jgi:hypothetical protein
VTPDSDIKDRIENPGQSIVLDAGYSSVYLEPAAENNNAEDEGDEDGDGCASFAFATPEPEIPSMTGPELPFGKGKIRLRKFGKRSKSLTALDFAKIAGDTTGAGGLSTAIPAGIDESIFSPASDKAADAPTDLMNILFSAGERPWEDENLPAAERMALMKILRTNVPDAQKRAEREEFEYRIRARSWGRSANVAPIVAAVAKAHLPVHIIKKAQPQPVHVEPGNAANLTREIRLEVRPEPFIRDYGHEEIYKLDRNLNASLGMGSIVGMPSSLAMLNLKSRSGNDKVPVDYLGLAEIAAAQIQARKEAASQVEAPVETHWNPLIRSRDNGFVEALNKLYSAIVPEVLRSVTPYRRAVWEDKILQQKENLADITLVAPEPAIPVPSPFADREVKMNISIPALK